MENMNAVGLFGESTRDEFNPGNVQMMLAWANTDAMRDTANADEERADWRRRNARNYHARALQNAAFGAGGALVGGVGVAYSFPKLAEEIIKSIPMPHFGHGGGYGLAEASASIGIDELPSWLLPLGVASASAMLLLIAWQDFLHSLWLAGARDDAYADAQLSQDSADLLRRQADHDDARP